MISKIFNDFLHPELLLHGTDLSTLLLMDKIDIITEWLYKHKKQNDRTMLYLIMYDIENNRIRTNIGKYLIRKGCLRIQKSIYLAKSSRTLYQQIYKTLKEINNIYENHDSIFLLPVPEEKFQNIKVIGKNVEFDLVTKSKNVLFF